MTQKKIVLIDDAQDTTSFIAESILRPEGYQVFTALDAETGLQLIREQKPDLIISDFLMPGMTGLDLLETLRANSLLTPFILITAEGSEALAVRALRLGVHDYIMKPFDIDQFLNSIAQALLNQTSPPRETDLRAILNYSADPIFITDNANRLRYFNQAATDVFGFRGVGIGQPLRDLITQTDVIALFEDNSQALRHYEVELSNGQVLNLHLTVDPNAGKIAIMQDISHLKELDRAKSDFVSSISHDLRSPLTTIMGYVELLERVGDLNELQKKFTQNILFSARSITAMLSDLLELNRIEAGLDTMRQAIQLEIIIRYAIETHLTEIERKNQHLALNIAPDLRPVLGNPIRLKQMVSNLLQNAVKYTPQGGEIVLDLYEDQRFIILQVTDTGIGIPLEDQQYIWDKFYRSSEAVDGYPGTGLGLAIVKSIVEAHSGRVWMESAPNEGATFTVMLPVYE